MGQDLNKKKTKQNHRTKWKHGAYKNMECVYGGCIPSL